MGFSYDTRYEKSSGSTRMDPAPAPAPDPDPMYWSLMFDRLAAPFSSNPIVRHIDSRDYRVGIAMRPDEYGRIVTSPPYPPQDIDFIHGLIEVFHHATEEQKIFFLQNKRNKIFDIVEGLLSFFGYGGNQNSFVGFLRDLLSMISVDPATENAFYHSNSMSMFKKFFKNGIADRCTVIMREFFLRIIHKYPEIMTEIFRNTSAQHAHQLEQIMVLWEAETKINPQSTLFSALNMQPMINRFSTKPLSEKVALLYFLKRTSAYQHGDITPATVLRQLVAPTGNNPWPNDAKIFNSYASILIDFLDEPHQLHGYFPHCTADQTTLLSKIILTESMLREARISQRSIFDSSCGMLLANAKSSSEKFKYLFRLFGLENDRFERWERTLFSVAGSRNKTEGMVKRTFEIPDGQGPNGCITKFLMPEKVALFRYLSQQGEKTFVALLDQGVSSDMIARMMYCDMKHPTVELCAQFLEKESAQFEAQATLIL